MVHSRARLLPVMALAAMAAPAFAQSPPGCTGSSSLGTFRIEVRRSWGGELLPLKLLSALPQGAHLIWEPVHLPRSEADSSEVTAILVPVSGEDLVVLDPHKATTRAEWQLAASPVAIAVVFGPQGLSMGKVRSLVTRNREVIEQIADYAAQTSKVESLIQELADAQQSGTGVDDALKGFATRYGVATPKLDASAPTNQQASILLKTVVPASGSYDPLATPSTQVQQSGGLAASVAGLFFGTNAIGLATGGAALVEGLKGAVFPGTEFRSAFAQNDEGDSLALCTKSQARKARTHIAYLWAYRVPNLKPPVISLAGPAYLPLGSTSSIGLKPAKDSIAKGLDHARDWRIVPVAGGTPATVAIHLAADSIELDLAHKAQPGDYKLTAMWDWDPIDIDGTLHLLKLPDFSHLQLTPESRAKLIEGGGVVAVKLTGADFEFLEKAAVSKAPPHPSAPVETSFVLPVGKRAGDQESVTVDIDAAAHGSYLLALTQSGGATHDVPFTVLPPNPTISGLPVRINLDGAAQPLRFEGSGLDRIESVSSEAGQIHGAALASGWAGSIRLKPGAHVGDVFAISLKVKDVAAPVAVPDAIKVFGPRPSITDVRKSVPATVGLTLHPDELPVGTVVGFALTFRGFEEASSSNTGEARPRVDLGCKSGGLRKALSLFPDDHVPGADLSAASPGMLFLSVDPGTVGYPGCLLAASIDIEPEGRSDLFTIGRVIRVPQLEQFTLTNEQLGPATYAGILKGRDLDVIEKTGWDAHDGVRVDYVPEPVPGDKSSLETIRVGLPWPAPAPHAPLYVWLRGDDEGRQTTAAY